MDICVSVSDTGVNTVEGAAVDTSALKPEPDLQRELKTPVLTIETSTTRKTAPREKKEDQTKSGNKPSKRQRMSSNEKDSATLTVTPGLAKSGSIEGSDIVVVETESPLYTISRRNTPIRQLAQAARLLLTISRLTKGNKP